MAEQFQEGASLTDPAHEWSNESDELESSTYQSNHARTRRDGNINNRNVRYAVLILCMIALAVVVYFISNHTEAANRHPQETLIIPQKHQKKDKGDNSSDQIEEEENKSQQPTYSQKDQTIDLKDENFNLWDLSLSQKQKLFQQYNQYVSSISLHKQTSNQAFINILNSKDKQAQSDMLLFQQQAQVIEWSKRQLSESESKQYEENFNKLLKEKSEHIAKLLQQYKYYQESNVLLSPIKNITKSQFYQAIKYHQLTGQTNLSQSLKVLSEKQKSELQSKYQLSTFSKQLRACVIVPTFNNTHNSRFMWNLQSILFQEYDNVKVIIIDDASPDNTSSQISKHLSWRKADPNKFVLIKSKQRNKSLSSFYYGAHKYCGPGEIIYTIDGDDELIGSQVFKTINAIYQKEKPYALYSIFIIEHPKNNLTLGNNHQYKPEIKRNNSFRADRSHGYGHLRTMLSDMFLYVDSSSFKDKSGKFYQLITDNAVYFCVMELSCGRVRFVEEINYWYDYNTGNNIFKKMNIKNYRAVQYDVEAKKPYRCFHEYFKDALAWTKEKQ